MQLTTTADQSLNGYMVTPREDTGTPLGADVAYVGSWEIGADMKHLCGGVSIHYDLGNALDYTACWMYYTDYQGIDHFNYVLDQ